ncbi:MAG: acylphosphatase [Caldimonas sp.]
MTPIECRKVRVHGRVQGVGFREACIDAARLDALCRWLRDGDPPGRVDRIDIEPVEPPFPRCDRFERMPTA